MKIHCVHSFSYEKMFYMWIPLQNMYLRAYEHLYALTKNCLQTKCFVCKESLVRHRRKIYWICYNDHVVQTTWNIYKIKMYLITCKS